MAEEDRLTWLQQSRLSLPWQWIRVRRDLTLDNSMRTPRKHAYLYHIMSMSLLLLPRFAFSSVNILLIICLSVYLGWTPNSETDRVRRPNINWTWIDCSILSIFNNVSHHACMQEACCPASSLAKTLWYRVTSWLPHSWARQLLCFCIWNSVDYPAVDQYITILLWNLWLLEDIMDMIHALTMDADVHLRHKYVWRSSCQLQLLHLYPEMHPVHTGINHSICPT